MKPKLPLIDNSERTQVPERRFPITDFNYQSIPSDYNAQCLDATSNSFRVTREYFNKEANHDFLCESAFFATIMVAVAVPLLSGVHAVLDLIRATGGI